MNEELDNTDSNDIEPDSTESDDIEFDDFPEVIQNAIRELDICLVALIKELYDFRQGESKEGDSIFPDYASELAEKFIISNKELRRVIEESSGKDEFRVEYNIVYYLSDIVWHKAEKYFQENYTVDITLKTIRSQAFIAVPGHTDVGPPKGDPYQEEIDEVKEKFGYVERTGCPRF